MQTSQDEMLSQPQQQILERNDYVSELEEIEEEVNQMAERIAEYRGTISVQLKTTVSSVLTAQRPVLGTHFDDGSESQSGSSGDLSSAGEEQKEQLLKQKISENASAIPVVFID
nr:uncharacterized protein LOC101262364 isoform X2 [Solanum lycopersicum]